MKKTLHASGILGVLAVIGLLDCSSSSACTTMIITKGAFEDGSVFVAHSDDSEMFDNRFVYVPPLAKVGSANDQIHCRERLGGMLNFYYREAA